MTPSAMVTTAEPVARAKVATAADTDTVIDTIVQAFAADPVVRWVFPDDVGFRRFFPRFAMAFGGGAVSLGTAYSSGSGAGAALWFAPGEGPDEEAMMAVMQEAVPAERMDAIGALFDQLDAYHPQAAHWYLPLIGVRPERQGEGHGSALLSHVARICDAGGLPAYLEATSARNIALYRRHGFEPMGEIRVPGSPVLTPMMRNVR